MMIDITRLRASSFNATQDDGGWRAGFNLWFSAWHQVPAGSLPTDEGELCKLADLGRDMRAWNKVRSAAMRGWALAGDGRLYHETVAEMVLEAWLEKLAQRVSSGAGNAKRYKHPFDAAPIYARMEEAAALLEGLNPQSKSIARTRRRLATKGSAANDDAAAGDADGIPAASRRERSSRTAPVPSRSLETGTGTETGTSKEEPRGSSLVVAQVAPVAGFDEFWRVYPRKIGKDAARKAYASATKRGAAPDDLIRAVVRDLETQWVDRPPDKIPHPTTWLNQGRWEDEPDTHKPQAQRPTHDRSDYDQDRFDRRQSAHADDFEAARRAAADRARRREGGF